MSDIIKDMFYDEMLNSRYDNEGFYKQTKQVTKFMAKLLNITYYEGVGGVFTKVHY